MKPAGFLALFFCLTLASSPLAAQTDEECLTCHGEQGLSMTKGGKEVSLSVDRNGFPEIGPRRPRLCLLP